MKHGPYSLNTMRGSRVSKSQANRQRHFEKCAYCRHSRKLCVPQSRDWEGSHEKCKRCEETRKPCGPSVKAPSKAIRIVGNNLASTSTVNTALPFTEPVTPSIMPEWWMLNGMQMQQALDSVLGAQQVIWKKHAALWKYQQKAALHQELLSIRELLKAIHSWLSSESERIAKMGTSCLTTMTQEERRSWLATLGLLQISCSHTFPRSDLPQVAETSAEDQTVAIYPGLWMALENICSNRTGSFYSAVQISLEPRLDASTEDNNPAHTMPLAQRLQAYTICELCVRAVMRSIPSEILDSFGDIDSVRSQLSCAFPAGHLAYLNGDLVATSHLWKHSDTRNQDLDITGMTLPHLIVANHDLNFLRDMCKHDPTTIHLSRRDRLGLTLLQTATAVDDLDCVLMLLRRGVKIASNQKMFNLAVDSNSPAIVTLMIQSRVVHPPFTELVRKAVINGYNGVVRKFYEQLQLYDHHSSGDVEMLANLAQQHGHCGLASELRSLEQTWGTPDQALEDLAIAQQLWQV